MKKKLIMAYIMYVISFMGCFVFGIIIMYLFFLNREYHIIETAEIMEKIIAALVLSIIPIEVFNHFLPPSANEKIHIAVVSTITIIYFVVKLYSDWHIGYYVNLALPITGIIAPIIRLIKKL